MMKNMKQKISGLLGEKFMDKMNNNVLILNIDKLHTTKMGIERIKKIFL